MTPGKKRPGSIPFIKICGLTQPENARACVRAGADVIGVVFYEKSPRFVTPLQAAAVVQALPRHFPVWGVFVNAAFDRIMAHVRACNLTGVQLHGQESPALVEKLTGQGLSVVKALFARNNPALSQAPCYCQADFLLVEHGQGNLPGGNAQSWDYHRAAAIDQPVILAGGLDPATIVTALGQVSPAGVDLSSGVEKSPGIKDISLVNAFVRALRSCAGPT